MKKENLGKKCLLKSIKLQRTWHGGYPNQEDFLPFVVMEIIRGGYLIAGIKGNVFEVKSKDIYFPKNN